MESFFFWWLYFPHFLMKLKILSLKIFFEQASHLYNLLAIYLFINL